jgi:hypothetical protein
MSRGPFPVEMWAWYRCSSCGAQRAMPTHWRYHTCESCYGVASDGQMAQQGSVEDIWRRVPRKR